MSDTEKETEPTPVVEKKWPSSLIWVDPDEFNEFLDAAEDMLNFGNHEGECVPDHPDEEDPGCAVHVEIFDARALRLKTAVRTFRPIEPEKIEIPLETIEIDTATVQ